MATYSSIVAWKIPWTEEADGLQGCIESDTTEHTRTGRQRRNSNQLHILVWEIPWTEEPGGLLSKGLQKRTTCVSFITALISQRAYAEAQGSLEVESSAIFYLLISP